MPRYVLKNEEELHLLSSEICEEFVVRTAINDLLIVTENEDGRLCFQGFPQAENEEGTEVDRRLGWVKDLREIEWPVTFVGSSSGLFESSAATRGAVMTTEREKLALEDAHARFHDQPGNMLPAKGCGWERCEFWDAGVEVIKALPNWVTPPEPTDEMVEAAAKAWHETKHRGQRWDAMQEQRRAHWRSVARVALIAALRTPPPEPDEWCREESCEYRHWRSGAIPTHKRFGSQCPAPAPPPVVGREAIARVLDKAGAQVGDCGHEPGEMDECGNGCRELMFWYADALLASGVFLSAGEHAAQVLEEAADAFFARLSDGTGNGRAYNSYTVANMLRARAREHREGTR